MNIFVKEEKRFNPFSLNSMAHLHIDDGDVPGSKKIKTFVISKKEDANEY